MEIKLRYNNISFNACDQYIVSKIYEHIVQGTYNSHAAQ